MTDRVTVLLAAGVVLPILVLLIHAAFRHFYGSARNLKDAIDGEVERASASDTGKSSAGGTNGYPDFAAEFQAQAKRSDDAHRARIRAHVERKIPPITDEGGAIIDRALHSRIAIQHIFPPRLPQRSMSYFGGLPIVPEDFDWPTVHNREGLLERLTFMAQIDCADLPAGAARDLFPEKGYLYFFAPMSQTFGPEAAHFVVRYEPRGVTKSWEPLDMPFTGPLDRDGAIDAAWRGKRTHYDRFEIAFGWIEEPSDEEVAARGAEGHAFKVAEKIRAERLEAFFGSPIPANSLLSATKAPKDRLWMPYAGFPINWKTARIIRRFVEAYHRDETQDVADRLKALGEVANGKAEADRLRTLQHELSKFYSKISTAFHPTISTLAKDYDAPPEEVKRQMLAFLEDLRVNGMPSAKERPYRQHRLPFVLNHWLATAAVHGAEGALADPDGAALVPADVVDALADRHGARKHQMLGAGEVVQVAADEMKERYILLLQLGPDPALEWTVGEMGPLQYWLTPEDLVAKRFENTVLTIEAY